MVRCRRHNSVTSWTDYLEVGYMHGGLMVRLLGHDFVHYSALHAYDIGKEVEIRLNMGVPAAIDERSHLTVISQASSPGFA
jgi:hypothetical protein